MPMEKYSMNQVKKICSIVGLKPAHVIGTVDGVQFTKGKSTKVEVISFEEFESILERKKLAVYGYQTWLKIMKDNRD